MKISSTFNYCQFFGSQLYFFSYQCCLKELSEKVKAVGNFVAYNHIITLNLLMN